MMIRKSAGDPDGPELRGIGGRDRGRHVVLDMIRQGRIEMKWLQDCSRDDSYTIRSRAVLGDLYDQALYLWLVVHRGYIFIHVRSI